MAFVLGIDAGNTKTIALVARTDGIVVGAGRGGCGDIYGAYNLGAGPAAAEQSVQSALSEVEHAAQTALAHAGLERTALEASVFSMAGADWPEDFELLQAAMEQRGLGRRLVVLNDALGALRAGAPDGLGVAVACGTGTATAARAAEGCMWHSSFWQGPHGSRDLAGQTLRAVYRAELGIDPPTALSSRVVQFLGMADVEAVLHSLTSRHRQPVATEGLARILLEEAQRGDATALNLVTSHGHALGDYASLAARKVGLTGSAFTLVLAGGVLRHPSPLLSDALIERVQKTSPAAHPVSSRFEPAV